MKRWASLILMVALLAIPAANAAADTYYVYNQWGGTWQDANKIGTVDSNLCWAAAASNILAWDNWGTTGLTTGSSIFTYFKGYWTNQGSVPAYGWQWWFAGYNGMQDQAYAVAGWAQLTKSGGGNFWTQAGFDNAFHTQWYDPAASQTTNLLAAVDSYLHSGDGVTLGIYKPDGHSGWNGHALTVWGFDYSVQGLNRTYSNIWVTDSDDGLPGLMKYSVSWDATNQWWKLDNYYGGGWHLADVEALNRNPVPIPASLLLLASGLLALAVWRRKFCHN